jgi:hypothetical protein
MARARHLEGAIVSCGVSVFSCRCLETPGHDGPHVCPCGGSWYGEDENTMDPVSLPGRIVGPVEDLEESDE